MRPPPGFTILLRKEDGKEYKSKLRIVMGLLFLPPILVILHSGSLRAEASIQQENIDNLVRSSKFIFQGAVARLNASNVPQVPVSESTVVVRVGEVFQAPSALGNFTGKEITVKLSRPDSVKAGQQVIFFTNSLFYGQSIAVIEVGRIESRIDPGSMRKQIADAVQRIADQELQKRLADAELVVVGVITTVRPATEQTRSTIGTEHDPEWREAVVQVESAVKGQVPQRTVTFLFPNSTDVMWVRSPKFGQGQEGIWILHRNQKPGLQVQALTALDQSDFHSKSQLDRIIRLSRNIR